jgi:hypothetical protein
VGTLSPGRIGGLLRHPVVFTLAMLAYVGVAFVVEPYCARGGEIAIGAVTWLVLLAAVRSSSGSERAQVAAVVLIATAGEVLGSLILGLYEYRRGGIPAFVPPGHGLVYLSGYRLAQSDVVRVHAAAVARIAIVGTVGWALGGLVLGSRPDEAGAAAAVALIAFLVRGREPTLFACVLFFVAVLELYGTAMGTWHWTPVWSSLHIGIGNPPSGVAAGYCAFDALALRLGPRLRRGLATLAACSPRRWWSTPAASSARSTSASSGRSWSTWGARSTAGSSSPATRRPTRRGSGATSSSSCASLA